MAALTVWKFNSSAGAGQALAKLESLQKQELIQIQDAAVVEWKQGKKKPKTKQATNLAGAAHIPSIEVHRDWYF